MNSSLWSADRATHLKIIVLAVIAGAAVTAVGIHGKGDGTAERHARVSRLAGGSVFAYSAGEHLTVR